METQKYGPDWSLLGSSIGSCVARGADSVGRVQPFGCSDCHSLGHGFANRGVSTYRLFRYPQDIDFNFVAVAHYGAIEDAGSSGDVGDRIGNLPTRETFRKGEASILFSKGI